MAKNLKICFYSQGFAFNRLVRLRYYEKIFPKEVEIFLITTNKYNDHAKWNLKRTKIIVFKRNFLRNLFKIRNFCKKNNLNILSNLGHPFGTIPLIFTSLFTNKDVLLYFLGDSIDYPKIDTFTKQGLKYLFSLIPYFFLEKFSHKSAFVGYNSYKKAPIFFLSSKTKFHYLHAPTNTKIFQPTGKQKARKFLKIKSNEKVILYVGRITRRKGGILLKKLIKSNPQIRFILIGKWIEKEIPKFTSNNMVHIEKIQNDKLPNYYSMADLVFAYHRQGCQMGIVGAESLACGTPIIHTKRIAFKDSSSILKISDSIKDANNRIKVFFSKSEKEIQNLSKEARGYASKHLSDEIWRNKYLNFYLR